jgi:hypothetical protein
MYLYAMPLFFTPPGESITVIDRRMCPICISFMFHTAVNRLISIVASPQLPCVDANPESITYRQQGTFDSVAPTTTVLGQSLQLRRIVSLDAERLHLLGRFVDASKEDLRHVEFNERNFIAW